MGFILIILLPLIYTYILPAQLQKKMYSTTFNHTLNISNFVSLARIFW